MRKGVATLIKEAVENKLSFQEYLETVRKEGYEPIEEKMQHIKELLDNPFPNRVAVESA